MLQVIHFVLGKMTGENSEFGYDSLLEDLRKHNIEVFIHNLCTMTATEVKAVLEEEYCYDENKVSDAHQSEVCAENALFVTDLVPVYLYLRQRKLFVLPYLHEGNRWESFPQAFYVIEQLEEMDYEACDMAYRRLAGIPWDILETDRLKVRETTVEDIADFYELYKDPSITEYMEDLSTDQEEEVAYIQDYIKRVYHFYGYGMWTVLTKADNRVIGRAGISWREGFDLPELGFMIGVSWQRQGYAYEVCGAILRYAEEELGMEKFQAFVQKGNFRSENLCRKLGFISQDVISWKDEEYVVYRR